MRQKGKHDTVMHFVHLKIPERTHGVSNEYNETWIALLCEKLNETELFAMKFESLISARFVFTRELR